ncbi:unnamed protein product, partial [Amoebophrya sp. A25]
RRGSKPCSGGVVADRCTKSSKPSWNASTLVTDSRSASKNSSPFNSQPTNSGNSGMTVGGSVAGDRAALQATGPQQLQDSTAKQPSAVIAPSIHRDEASQHYRDDAPSTSVSQQSKRGAAPPSSSNGPVQPSKNYSERSLNTSAILNSSGFGAQHTTQQASGSTGSSRSNFLRKGQGSTLRRSSSEFLRRSIDTSYLQSLQEQATTLRLNQQHRSGIIVNAPVLVHPPKNTADQANGFSYTTSG